MTKFTTFHVLSLLICTGLLAACGGTPANSSTSTPTTVMGVLPVEQSTPIPTQMATLASSDSSYGPATVTDICALVSNEDVAAVLRSAPIAATPGSDADTYTGVTINFCTYLGQGVAVVISTSDTASAQDAAALLQEELARALVETPETITTQETGVGDQLFWSVAEKASSYTVQVGASVFSVGLGGNVGDPASHKAALLDLAKKIAAAY
jgi:hypothetical protein